MRRRRRRKGAIEKNRGQCGAAGAARRGTRSRWHCTLAIPFTFRCQIISTSSGVRFRTDCDSTGIANGSGWGLEPIVNKLA
eukprot:gene20809-biopygen11627